MIISFDLDGVIADGHHWLFYLLNPLRELDAEQSELAELSYYSSRPLKYNPNLFLAAKDYGIILTARKPKAVDITHRWLCRHGIALPIYFVDQADLIDWRDYEEASKKAGILKAQVIQDEGVDVHFDNNPTLVTQLRKVLPKHIKVILVGGEL